MKDGFFRDEQGLLSMPHLTAFLAAVLGVVLGVAGLWAFVALREGWLQVMQVGAGLLAAGAGLEGYQSTLEHRVNRGGNA